MKKLIFPLCIFLYSCSSNKSETASSTDSLASDSTIGSAQQLTGIGPLSVLDIKKIKVYELGDTIVSLPDQSFSADSISEKDFLKQDSRVSRVKDGLLFTLSNGETKLLKENKTTEGDDYAAYSFQQALDDIGQWLVAGSYYESYDYILVDQEDGTETRLWGYPILSPDKKNFLTSSVDLEAGFVPNGFQLWSVEEKKPVKVYEVNLADWGFTNMIWTNDNHIIAEQTIRDSATGDLKKRIIKMRFVEDVE